MQGFKTGGSRHPRGGWREKRFFTQSRTSSLFLGVGHVSWRLDAYDVAAPQAGHAQSVA
jgi:hypothetical protein